MSTLTLFILLVNVFIMGVIAAAAVYYLRAHYKHKVNVVKPHADIPDPQFPKLEIPPEILKRISNDAEAYYHKVLVNSATYLQQGLVETATDLNGQVKNMVTAIINDELAKYRQEMDKLRQQAETDVSGVKKEMDGHKDELRATLVQEVEAEKQQLLKQIDTKLSDAVASFLIETLGHNVDLGNQNEYLTSILEEHKSEFVKEVAKPADDQTAKAEPATPAEAQKSQAELAIPVSDHTANAEQAIPAEVQPVEAHKEVPNETKPT